ncbi:MAG: hypothetical protein NVS4B8_12850 [Herpetosiphon sp.]
MRPEFDPAHWWPPSWDNTFCGPSRVVSSLLKENDQRQIAEEVQVSFEGCHTSISRKIA